MTHCLTCRHMLIEDWEENRVVRCGHDTVSELDSNGPAPVIVYLEYGSSCLPLQPPDWCPLRPSAADVLPNQLELFS